MDDHLAWRIAIHEAGHCVAARLLGLICGGATVWPDPHAVFITGCDAHSICALMAGGCAEALVLGDYDDGCIEHDWRKAVALLDALGDDDTSLWRYTAELLAPHMSLIVRLATELFRAGRLDGGEIDALLSR